MYMTLLHGTIYINRAINIVIIHSVTTRMRNQINDSSGKKDGFLVLVIISRIFDTTFPNNRFCASAVKICPKVS